jgi:hypothetical protein
MRCGGMLPFVLLVGALPACAAGASRGDLAVAELQARAAREDAAREHARLVELEAQIVDLEHRLTRQSRACPTKPDPLSVDVASARVRPKAPLRSQGDFLAEARVAEPTATTVAVAAPTQAAPVSDRAHLQQALDGLRAYDLDRQSGLSTERREALRVLLRQERQLDTDNPWGDR